MSQQLQVAPPSRRQEILDHAAGAFAELGVASASMSTLAARVGIQKASLYYFFASKEALLVEVVRPVVEQPYRELEAIASGDGPAEQRLAEALAALGRTFEEQPQRMQILVRERLERHLPQERFEEIRDLKSAYTSRLRRLIREGVEEGAFAPCDDKTAAFARLGSVNWMYAWFRPEGPLSGEEIGRRVADHFLWGLLTERRRSELSRGDR
jgi:TetR/AcrR family transcriptional regulator, cholesterol catabolism regulator